MVSLILLRLLMVFPGYLNSRLITFSSFHNSFLRDSVQITFSQDHVLMYFGLPSFTKGSKFIPFCSITFCRILEMLCSSQLLQSTQHKWKSELVQRMFHFELSSDLVECKTKQSGWQTITLLDTYFNHKNPDNVVIDFHPCSSTAHSHSYVEICSL